MMSGQSSSPVMHDACEDLGQNYPIRTILLIRLWNCNNALSPGSPPICSTNVTDIEIWNRDHTSQYHQGSDFSVLSPKTANNAIVCDLKVLQPYVVKRLHGGRIAAGEQVLLSYDFLPGKVDVEGHSTPNAFAEPECEPSCLLLLPARLPVCLPVCLPALLSLIFDPHYLD